MREIKKKLEGHEWPLITFFGFVMGVPIFIHFFIGFFNFSQLPHDFYAFYAVSDLVQQGLFQDPYKKHEYAATLARYWNFDPKKEVYNIS